MPGRAVSFIRLRSRPPAKRCPRSHRPLINAMINRDGVKERLSTHNIARIRYR